jgi:hypothetical protein
VYIQYIYITHISKYFEIYFEIFFEIYFKNISKIIVIYAYTEEYATNYYYDIIEKINNNGDINMYIFDDHYKY